MCVFCSTFMKNKRLSFRLTERRYHKLLLLSAQLEKTMSSLVDEWIDSLPEPKKGSTTDA
jgi:predicted DNA-binding protein